MSTVVHGPAAGRSTTDCPGYTRLSAQALNNTARAIAGDLFDVDPYLVRVFLRDDSGFLVLGIHLPLPIIAGAGSILDRSRTQRALMGERFTALTGALVSRVDIRITGVVTGRIGETQ